jgi:hypothetical protein
MASKRNAELEDLSKRLDRAVEELDLSAKMLVKLEFELPDSLMLVGEALFNLFELRRRIYAERPDLTPPHLLPDADR